MKSLLIACLFLTVPLFADDYTYVAVSTGAYRQVYIVNIDTPSTAAPVMRFSSELGEVADDMAMALSTAHKNHQLIQDEITLSERIKQEAKKPKRKRKK